MTRRTRLNRLERRLDRGRRGPAPADMVGIHDELTRDDPIRLSAFIQACRRAGLLDRYPAPEDDSQFAEFLRDAWGCGLLDEIGADQVSNRIPTQGRCDG